MAGTVIPPSDTLRRIDPLHAEWVTAVLLGVVVLAALIQVNAPRKWRLLGSSIFSMRLGRQALREEMGLQDRAFLGALLAGCTLVALFGWQVLTLRGGSDPYPILLLVLLGLVVAHYLVLRTIGSMLGRTTGLEEYAYTGMIVLILAGIALLPLVVFMAYQPAWRAWAVVAGGVVVGAMLLFRWLRGVWIGMGEGLPLRYIILYFCAAELIPVLLVIDHWRNTSSTLFHSYADRL